MAAATVDLSTLLEGIPPGAWVAISEDENRVVAYDADAQIAVNKAKEQGIEHPLVVRVPEHAGLLFL